MTPHEFLAVLDDAIAAAPDGRRHRRDVALEIHAPAGGVLLGERGTAMGSDDRGPVYGYTRSQCETMRAYIYAAARADAAAAPVDDLTAGGYTGDVAP